MGSAGFDSAVKKHSRKFSEAAVEMAPAASTAWRKVAITRLADKRTAVMHIIEIALITNGAARPCRTPEDEQAYFESASSYAPALRRAVAFVATVGVVVIALQVASAGAALHRGGVEIASISVGG
jgi:hypothetical protein